MSEKKIRNIAIIGGTGALGSGLALRWAQAGHNVIVGSRDGSRARDAAAELSATINSDIVGMDNTDAATNGDIVVMTVPYANQPEILESIRSHLNGKILVDVTVPLVPPKVRTVHLPEGGSVAKAVQETLGEEVRVVSAFQNVAAAHLADIDHDINCDVLVCGNDPEARRTVIELARDANMKAWHAGRIDNSAAAEALTSILIFINGKYKIDGSGIQITGIPNSLDAE